MYYLKSKKKMNNIVISNLNLDFNKIENFVESICEQLNVQQIFHGNVLIAITEVINYFESFGSTGELSYEKNDKEIIINYKINEKSSNLEAILNPDMNQIDLYSEGGKGIFMIMSLCDDLRFDNANSIISVVFKKEGLDSDVTKYRKQYLNNYLGKTVKNIK
jgi:hypothetical protein